MMSNNTQVNDDFSTIYTNFLKLFYIVDFDEAAPDKLEESKYYFHMMAPSILSLVALDQTLCYLTKRKLMETNTLCINACHLILFYIFRSIIISVEYGIWIFVYQACAMPHLSLGSTEMFIVSFFIMDFLYYVGHRIEHGTRLFWAGHCLHHNADYYDIGVSLRLGFLHNIILIPLAVVPALCIHPAYLIFHQQVNLLYQFWIHTTCVDKLGILDYVINTPSNHRVHHDNSCRSDTKNFGGFLMVWDHLFGTYKREEKQPNFRLQPSEIDIYPLSQQINPLIQLGRTFRATPGIFGKVKHLFESPDFPNLEGKGASVSISHDVPESYSALKNIWEHSTIYLFVHLLLMSITTIEHLMNPLKTQCCWCCLVSIIWLVFNTEGLLRGLKYVYLVECTRCILMMLVVSLSSEFKHDDALVLHQMALIISIGGLIFAQILQVPCFKDYNHITGRSDVQASAPTPGSK